MKGNPLLRLKSNIIFNGIERGEMPIYVIISISLLKMNVN